tara:strand:+ start:310 stop:738 length:429 start_codon:yes stop_codon:yes gene_type:complete
MAVRANKYAKQFDITAVVGALAGGVVAGIAVDQLEDKVDFFKDGTGEKVLPFVPAIVGAAIIYFMDDKYKPVGYGMLGASGLDVGEDLAEKMEGFSRINYIEPGNVANTVNLGGASEMAGAPMGDMLDGSVILNEGVDDILM